MLQILKWVKGYDEQKRLFLPPLVPGEKLPREIMQAWKRARPAPLPIEPTSKEDLPSTVEGSVAEVDQSSELKLPPSSTSLPQQGLLESRTPDVSTTALLSVPEIGIIESVTGLTNDEIESFSQINMDGTNIPPVAAAVARYMGIDLSPEGVKNELRKGIAFVVDGPPLSGRTSLARALGDLYKAAVINVDELLKELINKAETPEGRRMRQLCIDGEAESQAREEAASVVAAPIAGKRTSTKDIKDKEGKDQAGKQEEIQVPVVPFNVLPLPDSDLAVPEGSLLPAPLPRELICQILDNRVQQSDCKHGVVFDGVESAFTSCPSSALKIILEIIHNRKHIYVANIEMELSEIKERKLKLEKEAEMKAKEEKRLQEEREKEEEERAKRELEIDEEDYEALSEKERLKFDQKLLEIKREKNRVKQREREEKERLEHEREEEEKRIAEEMKKKKGKGRKVPTAALLASPSRPMSGVKHHHGDTLGMASQASFASGIGTPKGKAAKSPGVVADDHVVTDPLDKKFEYHTHHATKVKTLLADWDRVARVERPVQLEEPIETLVAPTKKSTRKPSAANVKPLSPTLAPPATAVALPEVNRDELGVPVIVLSGRKLTEELVEELLSDDSIPTPEQVKLHTLMYEPLV